MKKVEPEISVQDAVAVIGKTLLRVARAAQRYADGIECCLIKRDGTDGLRCDVPGLGILYFLQDGQKFLENQEGRKVELSGVPNVAELYASLESYRIHHDRNRERALREENLKMLKVEAVRIRNWRPRALKAKND